MVLYTGENIKRHRQSDPVGAFLCPNAGGRKLANEGNLIPLNKRTKEEQREIQSKGGIASGASRRAYKSLKQAAKVFFKENEDAAMSVIQSLYSEALGGNVKAVEKLQDLLGETVQREALALKKKALAKQSIPDHGKVESLIAGLQEVEADDIHQKAACPDEDVETGAAETAESP